MALPGESEPPFESALHEASKDAKAAILAVLIMALVQFISIGVYSYNAAQDRAEERHQQALNRQMDILKSVYDRQDKKYKEIEDPLIALRDGMSVMRKTCVDKSLTPAEKKKKLDYYKEERIKNKIALIQAYGPSQVFFGQAVFNKAKHIVNDIERTEVMDNQQLCTLMTSAYETELQKDNRELDQYMYDAMGITEQKINAILEKGFHKG